MTVPEVHFDAGALIALDRLHRETWALLRHIVEEERARPRVAAPVVTQVWRSGRQANLARALGLCHVVPTDAAVARRAGELCGVTGTSDAVDALVVATAEADGGVVVTSDPGDIGTLVAHARRRLDVITV